MKKSIKPLLFLSIFLVFSGLKAQNLIQNPGFESGSIPTGENQVALATGWGPGCAGHYLANSPPNYFQIGSPDLYDINSTSCAYSIPNNWWGTRNVRTVGTSRYVGFAGSSNNSGSQYYGESVEGTLTSSLIAQCTYSISLWASSRDGIRQSDGNNMPCGPLTPWTPSPHNIIEVVLRKSNDCTTQKIIFTSPAITQTTWTQVSGTFILTAADAAVGYDKIEFRLNNNYTVADGAAVYMDDVSLTPAPLNPVIQGNSVFCQGSPITFDASASATSSAGNIADYVWTVLECDQNGNDIPGAVEWWSPYINGAPGIYTIPTGTAGPSIQCDKYYKIKLALQNNCISWSQTIKIIYISCNPSFQILPSQNDNCQGGTVTLTTNLNHQSGYTYNWWIQGGSQSYTTPSFTFPSSSNTQIVNLAVTNSYGCSTTLSYTVPAASSTLCCQSPNLSITGNVSPQLSSPYNGTGLLLEVPTNYTLYINSNFTFTNTQIRMMPNSIIVVNPGITLTLDNCHLFGCTYMWEGINLMGGSQLSSINGTTIDDANIAILADGVTPAPTVSVNNTIFSKNYIGIEAQNYPTISSYPISLTATDIRGNYASVYSPGTNLKPYKRLWVGDIVYPVTTEIGVYANAVNNITLGLSGNTNTNFFRSLHYGVRSLNSNSNVNNCQFVNLNLSTLADNKGIWASGTSGGSISNGSGYEYILNIGTGSTANSCTFRDLAYGIYTDNCVSSNIQNNNILDVNIDAIYITGCSYYRNGGLPRNTSTIQNNYIRPLYTIMQNGIVFDGNTRLTASVLTNTINTQASSGPSEGVHIAHTATNITTAYTVNTNTISGNYDNGISCNNVTSAQININYLNVQKGWSASGAGTGISINNGSLNTITQNTVDATSQSNNRNAIKGISLNASKTNTVWCNNIMLAEFGLNSYLDCSVADVQGNTFNGDYKAINITWGSIGNQGTSTGGVINNFINSFSTSGSSIADIFTDNSTGQTYYVNPCASDTPTVATNAGTTETVKIATGGSRSTPTCAVCGDSRLASINEGGDVSSINNILAIFPNPSFGKVYISGNNIENAQISIHNLLGEEVVPYTNITQEGIDISQLADGTYFYTIKLIDGSVKKDKLIIIK